MYDGTNGTIVKLTAADTREMAIRENIQPIYYTYSMARISRFYVNNVYAYIHICVRYNVKLTKKRTSHRGPPSL